MSGQLKMVSVSTLVTLIDAQIPLFWSLLNAGKQFMIEILRDIIQGNAFIVILASDKNSIFQISLS